MAPFSNIALDFGNFSFGPVSGRVYSLDHTTDTMIVKTTGGTLVTTYPLNIGLPNEVLCLEWDGYYWYSLSKLGGGPGIGVVVNKWFLNGSILEKQVGVGNEINFINGATSTYDSEAMCVERYITALTFAATSGSSSITVTSGSISFLQLGMSVYIGPSTAGAGEVLERTVIGIAGNILTLNTPLTVGFNTGDKVIYRRNIWIFNNKHYLTDTGSLIQVNSYDGSLVSIYSSCEWKHATAATFNNGNICFVRNHQLLRYKPFGINAGYQNSALLNNIEVDTTTLIKVYDIEIDDTTVYKLQKKQHQYDTITHIFSDITSTSSKYEIDTEIVAAKVTSITSKRDRSVLFGSANTADFVVQVRDQYDVPVFGRSFAITEDDTSGFITAGFTSFTSDTDGKGTTRYSTGASPTFRNPTIFATDVGTQYRLSLQVDQRPNTSNTGFVQQEASLSNKCFVVQQVPSGLVMLEQTNLNSITLIDQTLPENTMQLQQYIIENTGPIQQNAPLEQITLIEQFQELSELVSVIQYDFLIFALPKPYSIKNPVNTDILVRIIGFGAIPLNSSTLIFKVNGVDITSQVVITPFGGGLELFYDPSSNFPYSSTVTVEISIDDTDIPPKTISTYYTFDIVSDVKKPIIETVYPPHHSIDNLPMTEVYAIIKDLETGVNLSSIQMFIEGRLVSHITEVVDNYTVKVSYQTLEPYVYESSIATSIYVEDNEGNRVVGSWIFNIKPSSGVLFNNLDPDPCDSLVPIDENICIEIFGLEDGVNIDSLTFNVSGKDVTYVLQPKVIRKG